MLRKEIALALLGAIVLAAAADRAGAAALGAYVDYASGTGTYQWDSDKYDFDADSSSGAIGFAVNNAPTAPANFNYRLNIGIESLNLKDNYDSSLKMGGIAVENVFGLALVRERDFRWWAGPLLRIGFYSGETDDYRGRYGDRYKTEADLVEFASGFATGINLRIGRNAYLAPSAGIRYAKISGTGTIKNLDYHTQYKDDFSGHSTNFYLNCSLFYD